MKNVPTEKQYIHCTYNTVHAYMTTILFKLHSLQNSLHDLDQPNDKAITSIVADNVYRK